MTIVIDKNPNKITCLLGDVAVCGTMVDDSVNTSIRMCLLFMAVAKKSFLYNLELIRKNVI